LGGIQAGLELTVSAAANTSVAASASWPASAGLVTDELPHPDSAAAMPSENKQQKRTEF